VAVFNEFSETGGIAGGFGVGQRDDACLGESGGKSQRADRLGRLLAN